ncbi:MAG: radical SAM protein [Planctomycetes bacterium]|nr:radical SAM protein [Planctomycetota bacterium]
MKISFINPPVYKGTRNVEKVFGCTYTLYAFPNIYVLGYAALLKKHGFEVEYNDAANDGTSEKKFFEWLKNDSSKMYVIYSVFLSMEIDIGTLEHIRKLRGNIPVVYIGPGPTNYPERYLRNKDENVYVGRGEVDFTLLSLAEEVRSKNSVVPSTIKGISYKNNESIINNPPTDLISNLDELPFPDRLLVDKNLYFNPKIPRKPFTAMLTARNCPYRCIYCVPNSIGYAREIENKRFSNFKKPDVKARSPRNVIEEFRLLEKSGYRSVSVIDDLFTFDNKRAVEICKGIKGIGIQWGCLARADNITDELAKSLSEANCVYVDMGVESFVQKTLDFVKKDMKVDTIYEAVKLLKKYRIFVKLNLLIGANPYESREEIEYTMDQAKKVRADAVMYSIMTPFPQTEFYQVAKDNNWLINGDYNPVSVQHNSIVSYENFSTKELEKMIKMANLSFYFRPSVLLKTMRRTPSFSLFIESAKALGRKLF